MSTLGDPRFFLETLHRQQSVTVDAVKIKMEKPTQKMMVPADNLPATLLSASSLSAAKT